MVAGRRKSAVPLTSKGVRMHAGIFEAERVLKIAPWQQPVDPMEGVIVHSC